MIYNQKDFIKKSKNIHKNTYNYKLVRYINSTTPIILICRKVKHKFKILPHAHYRSKRCPKCYYKTLPQNQRKTHKQFLKDSKNKHNNKYTYLTKYQYAFYKIKIQCNICNNIFYQLPSNHLRGHGGCKICKYNNLKQNKPMLIKDYELRCRKIHKNKYKYMQDFNGVHKKVFIFCKKCNDWFKQKAGAHLYHYQGCKYCTSSKGENIIRQILKRLKVSFETEKTFKDCKNIHNLHFDFYIKKYNLCIEFDGKQHFKPVKYWGGNKHFNYIKKIDLIKNNYCKQHKLKLLRISYKEFKNISEILTNYIKGYKHDIE